MFLNPPKNMNPDESAGGTGVILHYGSQLCLWLSARRRYGTLPPLSSGHTLSPGRMSSCPTVLPFLSLNGPEGSGCSFRQQRPRQEPLLQHTHTHLECADVLSNAMEERNYADRNNQQHTILKNPSIIKSYM